MFMMFGAGIRGAGIRGAGCRGSGVLPGCLPPGASRALVHRWMHGLQSRPRVRRDLWVEETRLWQFKI